MESSNSSLDSFPETMLRPIHSPYRFNVVMVAACPFPANRGTPSRILQMANSLVSRHHAITVVTYHLGISPNTCAARIIRTPGLPYRNFAPGPTLTKFLILNPLLFIKLLKTVDHHIDLIHAHNFEGALLAYAVRRIRRIPVIYDAHTVLQTELPSYPGFHNDWIARCLDFRVPALADHIIAVSDSLKRSLLRLGIRPSAIDVVPTGSHLQLFEGADGDSVRRKYGLGGKPIVMYTGSIINYQGIDDLLNAMRMVFERNDDVVLMLVGPQYCATYRMRSEGGRFRSRILFAGEQPFSEVPAFLAAADVVVSPRSECAGIPQKLTNYMAAGKAVVSFAGSAKLITHGHDGLVVGNHDTAAMADAIGRLLSDKALRNRLGENAKKSVQDYFDWDILTPKIEAIYHRVLSAAPVRGRSKGGRSSDR